MKLKSTSGFTLFELIIVIVGAAIIGVVALNIFKLGVDIYFNVLNRMEVVQINRTAMSRMTREISLQKDENFLNVASGNEIQLTTSTDDILKYDLSLDKIRLTKNNGSAHELIKNLVSSQSSFSFSDTAGTNLTSFPLNSNDRKIVRVINLRVQTGLGQDTLMQTSRIFPQNLHYGYRMPYHD